MSFLDSVLSSIGTGASTTPNPVKPTPVVTTNDVQTNSSTKRKAEDELNRPSDKAFKQERGLTKTTERLKPLPSTRQNVATPAIISPAIQSAQASSKPPKKGSFADIMARAKGAQAQPTNNTGSITHRPKDKVKTKTRKELVMEREAAKKAAKKGIPFTGLANNKDNTSKGSLKKPVEKTSSTSRKSTDQGSAKVPEKSGYQGTMQPSNTSRYTGTARPQTSTNKTTNSRDSSFTKLNQTAKHRRQYDESEDDESEDGYDYASEDYSDMDAGFDDMEDEEVHAEKIARKEDAAEQAELERLKREKDRKKMQVAKGKR